MSISETNASERTVSKRASNGTHKLSPCTPTEAMELLQSALAYCRQAGYQVRAGNRDAGLMIVIPGAEVVITDDGTTFRPAGSGAGEAA